ncbi:MAG: gliding motility-associated C-terminal domain-containing protein [Chitinophagales bacterium]
MNHQRLSITKCIICFVVFHFLSVNTNYGILKAQDSPLICEGSLGENIFIDGDFGSGSANNVTTNPQIAPGYTYTTATPPVDGFYVLTNNTGFWAGLYPSWLQITDNSDDPSGYMMVVNASFDPGLFYSETIDGLCENTLYEFSADAINLIRNGVAGHILPQITFLIDGEVEFSPPAIPQDEVWHSYGFTFSTQPGQTSVTLSIRNEAPGGNGNDLALDNITFRACGPQATILPEGIASFCDDSTTEPLYLFTELNDDTYTYFQWQISTDEGLTWTNIEGANESDYLIEDFASATYHYRYLLANSPENLDNNFCRLASEWKEVVALPIEYSIVDTLCEGLSYEVGTSVYTASGSYTDELISASGCDSIINTSLVFVPDPNIQADINTTAPSCEGGSNGNIQIDNIIGAITAVSVSLSGETLVNLSTNEFEAGTVFNNLATGDYQLTITDRHDCTFEANITIPDAIPIQVDAGQDTSIYLGQTFQINASSNFDEAPASWYWEPATGLSCTDCFDPIVQIAENTQYVLTVVTSTDCSKTDTLNIEVLKDYRVILPNAFSPNNDGINDYFSANIPSIASVTNVNKCLIYNRWGQEIFAQDNLSLDEIDQIWDGDLNDRPAEKGVYVYFLELRFIDETVMQYKGNVALLR